MKNITIIGSGSFGCALAYAFSQNNNVKIWSYKKEEADSININHECLFVKSIKLNEDVKCYLDYNEAISGSDIIVIASPSSAIRKICNDIKKYIKNQDILLTSKGMENDKLLSTVIEEELNIVPSILMGPSFAEEIGNDMPTFVELSGNKELIKQLETDKFKIIYNDDYIGLQIGGSLKNVITIATGIVEGLGYKINTSSYIFIEGFKEIVKIGTKLGAKKETFYGLSGLGDLYGTSLGKSSRNKRAGILLGQGKKIDEVKEEVGVTIEGLDSLKDAKYLIDKYKLDCPLMNNLYNIIYKNEDKNKIIEMK